MGENVASKIEVQETPTVYERQCKFFLSC